MDKDRSPTTQSDIKQKHVTPKYIEHCGVIDMTRNGQSLRPSLKSRTNKDYFLFRISYGIENTCICLS